MATSNSVDFEASPAEGRESPGQLGSDSGERNRRSVNEKTKKAVKSNRHYQNAQVQDRYGGKSPSGGYGRNSPSGVGNHNKNNVGNSLYENDDVNNGRPRSGRPEGQSQQRKQGQNHSQGQQRRPGQNQGEGHQSGNRNENRRQGKGGHKMMCEPYWPLDKVSDGLKRGQLFEGVIRVNPKNFEDSYVPLPDGSVDIYIPGLKNRNRALNGDVVAVELLNKEDWRVYTDDLETYQKAKMSAAAEKSLVVKDNSDSDDSGPDVIIEDEVEEISNSSNTSDRTCKDKADGQISSRSTGTCAGAAEKQTDLQDFHLPTTSSPKSVNKNTPSTPKSANRQSYTSVKDVLQGGSPIAKKLFSNNSAGEPNKADGSHFVEKFLQKTGKIVSIIERRHPRACGGYIKPMQLKNSHFALFLPTDSRVPRIQVPVIECPKDFQSRPGDHANTLFIARISDWKEDSVYAHGHISRSLGEAGEIEPETEALLIENDVDCSEFSEKDLANLPSETPWVIPPEEYSSRRDFRNQCVFTIDPASARDLDDAVSFEEVGEGTYEVGVHIADVSYFIQEDTPLNDTAARRATSVYLVQKVIPMLPRLLCEKLCSLNPDEDRLTFSVVWKMNKEGEIFEEWFGRSIIRSCVKLSYQHAQGFIEEPEKNWTSEDLPPISTGFTVHDISSRVLHLQQIAKCLRKARFDGGALRLDQVKIQYTLDADTGLPNGYFVYQQKDSNRLIEEFMLLANMAVAHKIYRFCPEKALLRRHPPPQEKAIDNLIQLAAELGVPLDGRDSGSLHTSLMKYCGDDEYSIARMQVLVAMCSKPMQNAKYFCTGMIDDEEVYRHYALNVPLYTHFTSPIRRYPDIMVHRLLAAALGYCDIPETSKQEIHSQADHCNERKIAAKRVSDLCLELFFSVFVKEAGPFEEKAMVMGVLDKSFDIFVLKFGVQKRVYCDKINLKSFEFNKEQKSPVLTLVWPANDTHATEETQLISIFTIVNAELVKDEGPLKWKALIKRP